MVIRRELAVFELIYRGKSIERRSFESRSNWPIAALIKFSSQSSCSQLRQPRDIIATVGVILRGERLPMTTELGRKLSCLHAAYVLAAVHLRRPFIMRRGYLENADKNIRPIYTIVS